MTEECFWWKVRLQAGDLPCAVSTDHVLFSTNTVPWGHVVAQSCFIGISQLRHVEMFDRLSLWSIYHSFFSGLIFLIFEGLEGFFAFRSYCAAFFLFNFFLFLSLLVAFSSLINSQTGIPSLAACLPGLCGISALQSRVGRKQRSSWVPIYLPKGHRTSVASMAPEIPLVSSCAPLSVGVKVRLVLSVSQRDVCGVLGLVQRPRPLSCFRYCACSLLLSCFLSTPSQSWGKVCPCLEPLSASSTSRLLYPGDFAAPCLRQQQWSSSGVLFLSFPAISEVGYGWEPAGLQLLWHSLVKLRIVPRGFPWAGQPSAGPTLESSVP